MSQYRERLQLWVREALGTLGGKGTVVEVSRQIWLEHEQDLRGEGNRFFTWQYDVRWAADALRKQGKLGLQRNGTESLWVLKP